MPNTTGIVAPIRAAVGETMAESGAGGAYVGCYTDANARALPTQLMSSGATIETCIAAAQANGMRYAGLQNYGACFAGNSYGYQLVNDSQCNTPCNANTSQMCGGSWRNSVYEIGSSAPMSAPRASLQ